MDDKLHCSGMQIITLIGLAAGTLTSLSMLPQLIKIIREKKAKEISLFAFIILVSGITLWIVYGYIKEDMPILVTNALALVINVCMIVLSLKYKSR
jgi:MtN3 and saliva related transmembrane protein